MNHRGLTIQSWFIHSIVLCCSIPLKYVVTEEVFFDIMIGNKTKTQDPYYGRIQIACFGEIVPITCLNFIALAKGYRKGRVGIC